MEKLKQGKGLYPAPGHTPIAIEHGLDSGQAERPHCTLPGALVSGQ